MKKPIVDDKDFWEDEDTILDQYQERKNEKASNADENELGVLPRDPNLDFDSPLQRVSSTNSYIAKTLERNPNGWMVTSINQMMNNDVSFPGFQMPEAEVNIRVNDPQLVAILHHAMQGYC